MHCSPNLERAFVQETVLWDLKIVRSRALASSARRVIVASMAGAEPAMVIPSIGEGHAAQVSADAHNDQPLHHTVRLMIAP